MNQNRDNILTKIPGSLLLRRALKPTIVRLGYCSRPSFMIIGAQKSGSSSLHKYLARHPQIAPAITKEIHFFDRDERHSRGPAWYHEQFPLPCFMAPRAITMDDTPRYLYHPEAPPRIYQYNPSIRLIVVLRDPVERAYSGWNMFRNFADRHDPNLRSKTETRTFEECINADIAHAAQPDAPLEPSYIRRGHYAEQLQRYFDHFPRKQLFIIDFESLKNNTIQVLEELSRFLGIDTHDWTAENYSPHNVNPYRDGGMSETARKQMIEYYTPHNHKLYQLLERDFGWQ